MTNFNGLYRMEQYTNKWIMFAQKEWVPGWLNDLIVKQEAKSMYREDPRLNGIGIGADSIIIKTYSLQSDYCVSVYDESITDYEDLYEQLQECREEAGGMLHD